MLIELELGRKIPTSAAAMDFGWITWIWTRTELRCSFNELEGNTDKEQAADARRKDDPGRVQWPSPIVFSAPLSAAVASR